MKRFKAAFLEGLVFFIPAVLTGWVVYKILRVVHRFLSVGVQLLPVDYDKHALLRFAVEASIVLGTLLFIVLAGLVAETMAGRFIRRKMDSLVRAIPLVNSVYDVMKQIFGILFLKTDKLLSRPVIVPFPHPGKQAIGFITGMAEPALREHRDGEYYKVFLPTVPIPTTGFFMIYPRDQITECDLTTEEALRLVLSGGILNENGTISEPPADVGEGGGRS
jgi:uncharacterized membrane protein